jgi:hypothetical protein
MNPLNWYWLADDGRIFSSASETLVAADDPAYVAWCNTYTATRWPVDGAGNQTDASLQEVLGPYGLFANLTYYCINARWQKEQGGMTLTSGMPIMTDDRAQAKINGVMLAAQYPSGPPFTTQWHAADGSFWPLDTPAVIAMSGELQAHINQCFEVSATTVSGIDGGTITTRDQVDQAFNW